MVGYQREDGMWDIEGHLRDIKGYAFESEWRGKVEEGTPVHDMWIRLTSTPGPISSAPISRPISRCWKATASHRVGSTT
jgi:hypothetical protein